MKPCRAVGLQAWRRGTLLKRAQNTAARLCVITHLCGIQIEIEGVALISMGFVPRFAWRCTVKVITLLRHVNEAVLILRTCLQKSVPTTMITAHGHP